MKAPEFICSPWRNDNIVLHLALIIIAVALVWGITCGLWSLSGATETYYVSVSKNILTDTGAFFSSSNETLGQNPPLTFWLFALPLKFAGYVNSFAPRIISVIFAFITLVCTYWCGRRLINPKAGLYGAFILATFPAFMLAATKVIPDMVFTGFITLSITAVITRKPHERAGIARAVIIWLCLIAAFLTRGPLALIMIILFMVLYFLAQGKGLFTEARAVRFVSGIIAGIVIIAIWLLLEYRFTGGTFLAKEFTQYKSLFSNDIGLSQWWWYFAKAGHILGIWALGLIVAVIALVLHRAAFIPKWYIWLFWFAPGFVLLCFTPDKNFDYALPLLPPLALFIGYYLSALRATATNGKISGVIALVISKLIMLGGIILCTAALTLFVQLEFAWRHGFYINKEALIVAFVLGLILILLGSPKYKTGLGALCGAVIITLLVGNLGLNAVVRPAMDVTQSSRYFSQNIQNMYPEINDLGLGAVNDAAAAPLLHVYGDYRLLPVAFSPDMFANAATTGLPEFILMADEDFANLTAKPELGGFAPVFWDTVAEKYDLVLLKRQTTVTTAPNAPLPLVYTVPKPLLLIGEPVFAPAPDAADTPPEQEADETALKQIYGADNAAAHDANVETPADTAETVEPPADEADAASTPEALASEDTAVAPEDTAPAPNAENDAEATTPEAEVAPMPDDDVDATEPPATVIDDTITKTEPAADTVVIEEPAAAVTNETPAEPEEAQTTTEPAGEPETTAIPTARLGRFSLIGMAYAAPSMLEAAAGEMPATEPAAETEPAPTPAITEPEAAITPETIATTPVEENAAPVEELETETATETGSEAETPLAAQNATTNAPPAEVPAVVLNNAKCVLAQGFMLANNELVFYASSCGGRNATLVDVNTYQPDLVRFYSVNLQNGFQNNAYAVHWFKTQSGKFKAGYNMLVINNLPDYIDTGLPYSGAFNRWAFNLIKESVNPKAVFFTGFKSGLSQMPESVFTLNAINQSETDSGVATKIQINFGLLKTVLRLEFDDGALKEIELRQ